MSRLVRPGDAEVLMAFATPEQRAAFEAARRAEAESVAFMADAEAECRARETEARLAVEQARAASLARANLRFDGLHYYVALPHAPGVGRCERPLPFQFVDGALRPFAAPTRLGCYDSCFDCADEAHGRLTASALICSTCFALCRTCGLELGQKCICTTRLWQSDCLPLIQFNVLWLVFITFLPRYDGLLLWCAMCSWLRLAWMALVWLFNGLKPQLRMYCTPEFVFGRVDILPKMRWWDATLLVLDVAFCYCAGEFVLIRNRCEPGVGCLVDMTSNQDLADTFGRAASVVLLFYTVLAFWRSKHYPQIQRKEGSDSVV